MRVSCAIVALFIFQCIGCAGSGLIGQGVPFPLPGAYLYSFQSDPPGAEIYFNGKLVGETPLKWERILAMQSIETVKVEARKEGYRSARIAFNEYIMQIKSAQNAKLTHWGRGRDRRLSVMFYLELLAPKTELILIDTPRQPSITGSELFSPTKQGSSERPTSNRPQSNSTKGKTRKPTSPRTASSSKPKRKATKPSRARSKSAGDGASMSESGPFIHHEPGSFVHHEAGTSSVDSGTVVTKTSGSGAVAPSTPMPDTTPVSPRVVEPGPTSSRPDVAAD